MDKRRVAILIYPDVEVLDFAGPFEVFSVASQIHDDRYFDVGLVAADLDPVASINGMKVCPNYRFDDCPPPDVLVLAGGNGSRNAMADPALLRWVDAAAEQAGIVLSVCSGARILAALGRLHATEVTTHHEVFDDIAALEPSARLRPDLRFVDAGRIVTSGGISAGIDASFHVVARLLGVDVARRTARYMEYHWVPDRDYAEPAGSARTDAS